MEDYKLSPNWNKNPFGNRFEEETPSLNSLIQELGNHKWGASQNDPFEEAIEWQKKRLSSNNHQQVMSYNDARKLFTQFWKAYVEGEDFYLDDLNVPHVQNILKWAICDPESEVDLSSSIWLWGNVGGGKSVFASALRDLFQYLHEPRKSTPFKGKRWEFADMNELFVAAKFDPSAFKVLNTPYSLILDELKAEHFVIKQYGQENRIIGDLISSRYSAWKRTKSRTFVTTNLPPSFSDQDILDDREIDRMREMFTSIQWHGESLRK